MDLGLEGKTEKVGSSVAFLLSNQCSGSVPGTGLVVAGGMQLDQIKLMSDEEVLGLNES